jgi:hypothetical protein
MTQGIDYFNRGHFLTQIQEKVSLNARKRMFQVWQNWDTAFKRESILDIGATPDTERIDSNCFLGWFNDAGMDVSCYSPETIQNLEEVFPFVNFLQGNFSDQKLPIDDRSYDWSTSSAVLEHVGSFEDQVHFVKEHARVSDALFLVTPNRSHWLEFHTKVPFIHWLPRNVHRFLLRLLGMKFWAEEKNLRLVRKSELKKITDLALGNEWNYEIKTISTLGMPSNLILLAARLSNTQT